MKYTKNGHFLRKWHIRVPESAAKVVHTEEKSLHLFGLQQNSIAITSDIISPIGEDWDVNFKST